MPTTLYTTFTLADPKAKKVPRYVGMTSQTVAKRMRDMTAAARTELAPSYKTLVSEWIRQLAADELVPVPTIWAENASRDDACENYKLLLGRYLPSGMLLNSRLGRTGGVPLDEVGKIAGGRKVDESSDNAVIQAKAKGVQD